MSARAPSFTDLDYGITAIDVDYAGPLIASSHLIVENGSAAFVDTGTNHSIPLLLETLNLKGIAFADVEFVFLTHIHLDHAGGAGTLMRALPNAQLVVHPRGARHMIDPGKLIEGSIAVYGEKRYREFYGDIVPVDEHRVHITRHGERLELAGREFEFFFTEGHARHHHCIADPKSRGIFTGDSFGISYRVLDTEHGEFIFPTTTPVHFDPEKAHESVDVIAARKPERVYLTHFSQVTDIARLARDLHLSLDAYVSIVERLGADGSGESREQAVAAAMFEFLSMRLDDHGFDPDLERRHAILDMDCRLNAQGLIYWYDNYRAGA